MLVDRDSAIEHEQENQEPNTEHRIPNTGSVFVVLAGVDFALAG